MVQDYSMEVKPQRLRVEASFFSKMSNKKTNRIL